MFTKGQALVGQDGAGRRWGVRWHHECAANALVTAGTGIRLTRGEMVCLYRDDTCAVCGESLPPDHFYCREHGATVDARLHEIAELYPRIVADLQQFATLLGGIADQTWDYLAELQPDDPDWPPAPEVLVRADGEDIDVDVDSEPGFVTVRMTAPAPRVLSALATGLAAQQWRALAAAARDAEGLDATH